MWVCKCDCGNTKIICGNNLRRGLTRTCGCSSHGKKGTRLYNIWGGMKKRCYNPAHKFYTRYGGRGITVCDEWKDNFEAFEAWAVANGYADNLTIDRIDNDGNYCPENCRFATQTEQVRNRSISRVATINGTTKSLIEWANDCGIPYQTVYHRYRDGLRGIDLIKGAKT